MIIVTSAHNNNEYILFMKNTKNIYIEQNEHQ